MKRIKKEETKNEMKEKSNRTIILRWWNSMKETPDWSLHKIKNDRDTLKKKARFNMKNVNKQKNMLKSCEFVSFFPRQ